ncbi:L-rhamnose-binding lectin CSL2 isoform X2 [Pseudorasbora parva]|uniref:L-rhamnose-binding lectin CSL2 isoform X2 n=1 Tax=Pseudorasbora parva TaxID=51549 RepID=UPI00351F2DDC
MVVQKLSWIISLLFLYQHGAEATRIVTCERESAILSCDEGFIKVLEANYGRTDRRTCSIGRPANQISNTHCFQLTSLLTMSTRCDGSKNCTVLAGISVFSDPCFECHKYLNVSYDCIPAKRSVICQNAQKVIVCDTGVISIHHANYGRRDLVACPHPWATTKECYSPQTSSLQSKCNGRRSCQLKASNSVFSDPCPRFYKYLEVTYSCS